MQNSRFTSRKGFVFSLDAAVSILLVIGALFLITQSHVSPNNFSDNSRTAGQDALATISKTGYLGETLDSNSLDNAAMLIRQKMQSLLPQNLDARVELTKYSLDTNSCRTGKNFPSCFGQSAPMTAAAGPAVPQKDVFSSNRLLILGQNASECDLDVLLAPKQELIQQGMAFFSGQPVELLFQAGDENLLDIDFNVSVNPPDVISCDQNVDVTLTVTIPEVARKPIDMMLVIDRSGSMSWNGELSTSSPNAVYLDGNTVFLADGSAGVRSINVSNPFIPALRNTNDPGTIIDVYGKKNYVFLGDTSGTDELIDINATNPSNLVEVDQLNLTLMTGLFVDGNYAYVAGQQSGGGGNKGMAIVNITNPANSLFVSQINTTDPQDVFVDKNYAYLADGTAGLRAIDVSNKASPVLRGTINTPGSGEGVFKDGNYAYVADGSNGLVIVNVSNPASLLITGSYNTPGTAHNVFVDGNHAYVADGTSLQKINVSNKAAPFLERTYASAYNYLDVTVKNNIGYIAASSIGLIVLDLTNGPRIDNAQDAAKSFVDFNGWTLPPDRIGLSSFNTTATLNQSLTSVKADINAAINSLVASGGTNIQSGIDSANTQLTGANANPQALKFELVLSDGQSNDGNSQIAAQTAKAAGITIFTVAFGADADVNELARIAKITGGIAYTASDSNALQAIFNIIALEIAERAADVNVSVPSLGGALVVDPGTGVLVGGNLLFHAGDISNGVPWSATYRLNFPCSSAQNCGVDAVTLPGPGAKLTYVDTNGISHTIDFNAQKTLDFHERDLNVTITSGTVVSDGEVYLDILVQNVAELDANAVDMNFFKNDLNGPPITKTTVPALCSAQTPGCINSSTTLSQVFIPSSGKIYATIGSGTEIRECPAGNTDAVFCGSGSPADFIGIKYYIWRK